MGQVCADLQSQGIEAVSYHAGKDAKQRQRLQKLFVEGKRRVMVATVAFGMGIDKVRHTVKHRIVTCTE